MPQKTWVVGEEVLAADFNSYIQQQVVPQFPNTATRDGWTAPPNGALCVTVDTYTVWLRQAGAWKALTTGTTPAFRIVGGGGGQSCPQNTIVVCTFASEASDPLNAVTAGVFTCPAAWAGRWQFDWSVRFPGPSTGIRNVYLNVGVPRYGQWTTTQTATGDTTIAGSATVVMGAGATANVTVFQSHSGGLLINSGTDEYFQGYWVGPN
jgi:hypothetical protein